MDAAGVVIATASLQAQQKDNLCGPFWAARVLKDAGFAEWDGQLVDEDLIALRAGTTLPDSSTLTSVPPGAMSRTAYRYRLPVAPVQASGTSPSGLMQAIDTASAGALRCVPIRGLWTDVRVERLVDDAPRLGARLIANVQTGRFWGSRPHAEILLAELDGRPVTDPAPDWNVGHFVELATLICGQRRSLVVVRDSYPSLGWEGVHAQPTRVVAAALLRDDGREGGVLAVVQRDGADAVVSLATELGLDIGTWNNGTGG
jgi:hypothetical protein